MSYNCEILADNLSPQGERLTTFKLTYPRIVHAELMTHRMFSRNAASSRAVPVKKIIESVRNNMFTPLAIQKAHKGMQGSDYFEGIELEQANKLWIESAELALQQAEKMEKFGITKQLINRILEPYQYYQVLVTATEWSNFFELRCPEYVDSAGVKYRSKKDYKKSWGYIVDHVDQLEWLNKNKSQADIHIQAIAELMWDAYNESTPLQLESGEWHIPNFGHEWDNDKLLEITNGDLSKRTEARIKISTAHNARISYQTLGDNPKIDYEADIKLHDMLLGSRHFSPFEHCARAMSDEECSNYNSTWEVKDKIFREIGWCRNFKGFIQYRHLIE